MNVNFRNLIPIALLLILFSCNQSNLEIQKVEAYDSNGKIVAVREIEQMTTVFYFFPDESCEECAAEILNYYSHLPNANLIIVYNKENSKPSKNEIANEYVLVGKHIQPLVDYFKVQKRPYFIQIDKGFNILNEGASLTNFL